MPLYVGEGARAGAGGPGLAAARRPPISELGSLEVLEGSVFSCAHNPCNQVQELFFLKIPIDLKSFVPLYL